MKIALLKIGDGRDEIHERADASLREMVDASQFDQVITIDDRTHDLGFAGAIQRGWDQVECDFIFHMEMDFTFNWPVDLGSIVQTLEDRRYLTQIALLRQPVNPLEIEAGGIIPLNPAAFDAHVDLPDGRCWIEHNAFFTTNPCVYPRWIAERRWPQREQSEGHFGIELFAEDSARRSAFWGHGEQWVHHIGDYRAGKGY